MTEEAVLHTELKMKRLLLEEDIWQHRRELLEDGLPGSKKKYQQGDRATSLLSLTHSYAGRTQDFTLVNQLFGHCVWKHWNEEGHMASDWFLGELLVSNLFPSALPCARFWLKRAYRETLPLHCSQLADKPVQLRAGAQSRLLATPFHLKLATWHWVNPYTAREISPMLCEGDS